MCADTCPTFHVADPECLVSANDIRHRPIGSKHEISTSGWLPDGPVAIGFTSGASTPDNLVATAIKTLEAFCH
jgi:4-hydroxy-3-methylbut-2-enyl diphosphate reductase